MIILWTEDDKMCVYRSTGEHNLVDVAKFLLEQNVMMATFVDTPPFYSYGTNEKAEKISLSDLQNIGV